jgi:hypothetical protein
MPFLLQDQFQSNSFVKNAFWDTFTVDGNSILIFSILTPHLPNNKWNFHIVVFNIFRLKMQKCFHRQTPSLDESIYFRHLKMQTWLEVISRHISQNGNFYPYDLLITLSAQDSITIVITTLANYHFPQL